MASSSDCEAADFDMDSMCFWANFWPNFPDFAHLDSVWIAVAAVQIQMIVFACYMCVRVEGGWFSEALRNCQQQEPVAKWMFRIGVVLTTSCSYIDVISDIGALRLFVKEGWWAAAAVSMTIILVSPLLTYFLLHQMGKTSGRPGWKDVLLYMSQGHLVAAAITAWQTQRASTELFWGVIIETQCEAVLQCLLQVYAFAAAPGVFAAAKAPFHLPLSGTDWLSFSILFSLFNMGKTMALLIDSYGSGLVFLRAGDEVLLDGELETAPRIVESVFEHGVKLKPLTSSGVKLKPLTSTESGEDDSPYRHISQIRARANSHQPWRSPDVSPGRKTLRLLHRVSECMQTILALGLFAGLWVQWVQVNLLNQALLLLPVVPILVSVGATALMVKYASGPAARPSEVVLLTIMAAMVAPPCIFNRLRRMVIWHHLFRMIQSLALLGLMLCFFGVESTVCQLCSLEVLSIGWMWSFFAFAILTAVAYCVELRDSQAVSAQEYTLLQSDSPTSGIASSPALFAAVAEEDKGLTALLLRMQSSNGLLEFALELDRPLPWLLRLWSHGVTLPNDEDLLKLLVNRSSKWQRNELLFFTFPPTADEALQLGRLRRHVTTVAAFLDVVAEMSEYTMMNVSGLPVEFLLAVFAAQPSLASSLKISGTLDSSAKLDVVEEMASATLAAAAQAVSHCVDKTVAVTSGCSHRTLLELASCWSHVSFGVGPIPLDVLLTVYQAEVPSVSLSGTTQTKALDCSKVQKIGLADAAGRVAAKHMIGELRWPVTAVNCIDAEMLLTLAKAWPKLQIDVSALSLGLVLHAYFLSPKLSNLKGITRQGGRFDLAELPPRFQFDGETMTTRREVNENSNGLGPPRPGGYGFITRKSKALEEWEAEWAAMRRNVERHVPGGFVEGLLVLNASVINAGNYPKEFKQMKEFRMRIKDL